MKNTIGWIIVGTFILYLLSIPVPSLLAVPTLLAWLVPITMWRTLGKGALNQAILLLIAGAVLLFLCASNGVFLGWKEIFAANLPLLAMFVAVSFLGMTNTGVEDQSLPKGKRAVVVTALGTHLLGSIINLSVLFVFGDRLQKNGILTRTQLIILARSFCAAAWWSPFFVATGVALTYSPGMSLRETMGPGASMSIIAICYSMVEVCFFRKEEFSGYPLRVETLTVPVSLAAMVLCVHYFAPDVRILTIICLLSPVGALVFMKLRPRLPALHDFITNRMSSVSSQFTLFLAAGVFSTGIKSLTHVYPGLFSLDSAAFTPGLFSMLLGIMIFVGIIGVHPVVSISILSPLILPLNVDPSQLGFLFVSSWAISTGSSPLSGVGLALVSRYHASPRGILLTNWHYALIMWLVTSGANILFF